MKDHAVYATFSAVDQVAAQVTVPLIVELGDRGGIHGTGTLFKVGGAHYLVTAQHVAAELDSGQVGVLVDAFKKTDLVLGRDRIIWNERCDVAVFRIDVPESVERLKAAWEFLMLDNISIAPVPDGSAYMLCGHGYPTASTQKKSSSLNAAPLVYITSRYQGPLEGFKVSYELSGDIEN